MSLHLQKFPLIVGSDRVSFHNGFGDARPSGGHGHSAIDIGAPRGYRIVASTAGTVIRSWVARRDTAHPLPGAGWSNRGGHIVLILDANGYVHYYAHMNRPCCVRSGQSLAAGQPLGEVGNSGSLAAGSNPHLHYQVWVAGRGRDAEVESLQFSRPLGRSVNPHSELVRLARGLGATVFGNGGVVFNR